jgi:hypothetical protein
MTKPQLINLLVDALNALCDLNANEAVSESLEAQNAIFAGIENLPPELKEMFFHNEMFSTRVIK